VRKLLVLALSAMAVVALIGSASASTRITWRGQGSESLPCQYGGHWVLTGKGITSAKVNGVAPMYQNGGGSFAYDSVGPITSSMIGQVYAVYEGTANNPQFVLSHCNAGYGGYDPYA
jgi:hypothetical protein